MIPELVEQTLNTPWHLAKGMAHLAGAPIRAITGTEYLPKDEEGLGDSDTWTSVYDIADPMMDITTVIYFYTELRSATKKRLEAYAKTKKLSVRVPFQKLCPDKKSDVETIRIAVAELKANLKALESKPSRVTAVVEYQKSLKKIEDIKAEFNLGDGDMQVFKIYFAILEEWSINLDRNAWLCITAHPTTFMFSFSRKPNLVRFTHHVHRTTIHH